MAENLIFPFPLIYENKPFLIDTKHATKYLDKRVGRVGHFKPVILNQSYWAKSMILGPCISTKSMYLNIQHPKCDIQWIFLHYSLTLKAPKIYKPWNFIFQLPKCLLVMTHTTGIKLCFTHKLFCMSFFLFCFACYVYFFLPMPSWWATRSLQGKSVFVKDVLVFHLQETVKCLKKSPRIFAEIQL